jgi:peptide-methionine (S)-S-oxide reductase
MQAAFEKVPGVVKVTAGFTGGETRNPTYELVSMGVTGHAESVEVVFDPARVTYDHLLDVFWHNIDPTQAGGQFCDRGGEYRTAVFYHGEAQRLAAEASKKTIEDSGRLKGPVLTQIVPASAFYAAEEYHQDFYRKNPLRYQEYRAACGRDHRLKDVWGDAAGSH